MTDHLKELERLENEATKSPKARATLGHNKVALGFAAAGLRDLLEAHGAVGAQENLDEALSVALGKGIHLSSDDSTALAQMGEALRVYARDVLASRSDDLPLGATLEASIACFDAALRLLREDPKKQAWVHAHRGAARMMLYWMALAESNESNDDLFDLCEKDFTDGIELFGPEPPYSWALQFSAFLHALRGKGPKATKGDFDIALERLGKVDPKTRQQASIHRSEAMLYGYNSISTKDSPQADVAKRTAAARASLNSTFLAQSTDQDEFLAPYSGATSRLSLYQDDPSPANLKNLEDAVELAETRAKNAMSQALTAMLGLTLIRGKLAAEGRGDLGQLSEQATFLNGLLHKFPPDLESFAMFIRDPVWQMVRADERCAAAFPPINDQNRNRKAMCEKRGNDSWNR